ncbi:MAG: hypothetical protein AAGN64_08200 [Bacteroidota bacterium]
MTREELYTYYTETLGLPPAKAEFNVAIAFGDSEGDTIHLDEDDE